MFAIEYKTTSFFSLSSHRSSTTTLSDACLADKLALIECIEIIKANVEDLIINKTNEKEKKWWIDRNYKTIDEKKLSLIHMEDVNYDEFEKNVRKRTHRSSGKFTDQFKEAFYNLSRQDRVRNIGTTTYYTSGRKLRKG
ncbi:3331_t:CDS:2, partial [Funneliformis geosporum]